MSWIILDRVAKAIKFATLGNDFFAPRSADMSPFFALYPMIPESGIYMPQVGTGDKATVTIEKRVPVASTQVTETLSLNIPVGGSHKLANYHVDASKTFAADTLTEGTDYIIDYTQGRIINVKTSAITTSSKTVTYSYFPYNNAEGTTPAESKTQTTPETEDFWYDRVKVVLTREAERIPMWNTGYATRQRVTFAAMFDLADMIGRSLANSAWTAFQALPSGQKTASGQTMVNEAAYKKYGEAVAMRKDAGFNPTIMLCSHKTANAISDLTSYFNNDALPSSVLTPANAIQNAKGLRVVPIRYWQPNATAIRWAFGQPPFARYVVQAGNGIQLHNESAMLDTNGNIVDGTQFIIGVNHYIGGFYLNDHMGVLTF